VTYLQRAVDQAPWENDDDARCNLAVAYLTGTGVKRDEKRGRQLLSVAMKNGHPEAARVLAKFDAPRTKAEYLAKLDEACASDDDPELRKAAQWMKGMLESGRGKLVKSGGAGTGERANAKKKRVNPKKQKGRAAKRVITVDCATLK
jgi:TPR repeat protein